MIDTKSIYSSKEFSEAWYNQQTNREDVLRTRMMNSLLLEEFGDLIGCTVLDAGCGHGFFIDCTLERNPKSLWAFDISSYLVRIALEQNPAVRLCVADLSNKLPYASRSFDTIICYNVLMELADIHQAMFEISRVTKPNGRVHVVIVHPLYNLFINDKLAETESAVDRLRRYTQQEQIHVTTIREFNDFVVHRRPLSQYVNTFSDVGLSVSKMLEVPIDDNMAEFGPSFERKLRIPVFVYFKLRKIAPEP